ncbi:SDR family NAD(P)-dependent oxidoreductase [Salaquimonas pukyongi]|uniref:SDR family NAD(P)-dependent oxidoreductase n=1 Tax=Salaquimonas pukyongi TaxID=2712698 RepID=UPI00096BADED|nr:SDR family NAD(P)-dependent oxidoreductase [Salaquimonas pukyongi]
MDVSGKTALVTGANRGIGLAIAEGLKAEGCRVIIGARDLELGRQAAEKAGVEAVHLDLESADRFEAVLSKTGGVDILVNNAGVLFNRPMIDHPEDWATSLAVILEAPYQLCRLCAPHMRKAGWGRIVNLSSDWGAFSQGLGGPGAYGVHKAALNALTLALSRELPETIKINAMCPGWVHTRMGGSAAPRTPQEGADTAIWLATLGKDGPTGGFFRDRKLLAW